jgi:hypothetical protein
MTCRLAGMVAISLALASACASTPPPNPQVTPSVPGSTSSSVAPVGSGSPAPAESGPSPVSIAPTSACSLLFEAEVAQEIGTSIASSQEWVASADESGWISDCRYFRQTILEQVPLDVNLGAGATYLANFEELKSQEGTSLLEGIGDEAVLRLSTVWGVDQPLGALFARVGDAVLGLSLGIVDVSEGGGLVLSGDATAQGKMLTDLATLAIGRLTGPPEEATRTCQLISVDEVVAMSGVALSKSQDVNEHDVWGPACHYSSADEIPQLDLAVNSGAQALANFDSCGAGARTVPGLGDAAVQTVWPCEIRIGLRFNSSPLLVRTGDTVLTVGVNAVGSLGYDGPSDLASQIAALALSRLGLGPTVTPGVLPTPTPTPAGNSAVEHPCDMLTAAEVGSAIGVAVEARPYSYEPGTCEYWTAGNAFEPLVLRIGTGQVAVDYFNNHLADGTNIAVDGIGDEAWREDFDCCADYNLLGLYFRTGEVVVQLLISPIGESPDGSTDIAPGTPDEQMTWLSQWANLILSRLGG